MTANVGAAAMRNQLAARRRVTLRFLAQPPARWFSAMTAAGILARSLAMRRASADRSMIAAIVFNGPALAIHVSRPSPVRQRMMGPCLVAAVRHGIKYAVNSHDLLAAATIGGVGMEYLARVISVENTAARQILNPRRPFGRSAEIVLRSSRRHILRSERDVEVVIEIVVKGRDPEKRPSHPLADKLDLFDRRAGHDCITDVMVLKMRQDVDHVIDLERAAHALVLCAGRHHEMLDIELAASPK